MRWNKILQAFFSKHQEDNLPIQPSVKKTTERTWLNFLISLFIIFCASALREIFYKDLGRATPYLTYYPAVMIAAIIGGLPTGLITTFFSAILVFVWLKQGQMSSVELWAMVFFVMICTMISWLAHAMRKANKKVTQMKQNLEKIVEERTKELRKSEERYELAVDGSAVGMYDWDINSGKVYYSDLFKELLGYDAEEPWDKLEDAWSRIHPDDYQTVVANIERYNEKTTSNSLSHEFRLKTKSGEYRWFHGRGKTIWDKDSKPVRMAGSMTDITEAKLSQEKLMNSEQRFRSLMEQSPLAIELLTPQGQISHVNKSWMRLWRVNEEETVQVLEKYNMLTDKESENRGVLPLIKKAFAGEAVILPPIEYVCKNTVNDIGLDHLNPNTVWIQCHLSPVKNENQEILFVVNTYLDLTDLRRSEMQINEMASFAELNPSPVLRINSAGILVSCNPATQEIFGKDAKKGTSLLSLLPDLSDIDLNNYINDDILSSREISINGRFYLFTLRGVSDLKFLYIYGNDITKRRKSEQFMNYLRDQLLHTTRRQTMGELSSAIAHELNQPLTSIMSNAQAAQRFLNKQDPQLDKVKEILSDIVKSDRRAGDVIRKMRLLLKKDTSEFKSVNIAGLLREVIDFSHSNFIIQSIVTKTHFGKNIPLIMGDKIQLQQVLLNLILNACASFKDTKTDNKRIDFTIKSKNEEVCVMVKDNGCGIDNAILEKIFDSFVTSKEEGMGMGLAISKTIIEAHDGKIWVENNPDKGACFYITLPVNKGAIE